MSMRYMQNTKYNKQNIELLTIIVMLCMMSSGRQNALKKMICDTP